ncbi:MAG TPA: hypothetical protein VIS73_04445 [Rhodocyclaceae bacterium]
MFNVKVVFGKGREYDYVFQEADLSGATDIAARQWFDSEFEALECEPSNPVGKVLIIDKILNVAKYGGEDRFAGQKEWAHRFARNTALALGRDTICVDVAGFSIGY